MSRILKTIKLFIICIGLIFPVVSTFTQNISNQDKTKEEIATFAGGCFWCVQKDFDQVRGVTSTIAGYTGGKTDNPTYNEVSEGKSGHVEAVQITYNSEIVSYEQLLDIFFHNIDPTDDDGQFCDRGTQYRPIIFYHGTKQERLAQDYKMRLMHSKRFSTIKVEILPAGPFYPAEEYHQKYYKKHPLSYKFYRYNCGRDKRLKQLWQ